MSYDSKFLGGKNLLALPELSEEENLKFSKQELEIDSFYLDYHNFSLLQNPFRKFPYYTIANINGGQFRPVARKDAWSKDPRIHADYQFGAELYSTDKSDFDRGHMTKREDVQWGATDEAAREAALSTFSYTNAVPQVDRLNRGIWSKIEKYILHSEAVKRQQKITLITGPVLSDEDPEFVTTVRNEKLKIPVYFWKIIYFLNSKDELQRTAFIVSQRQLLEKRRIVKTKVRGIDDDRFFMTFKNAETYQAKVKLIEDLTGLKFQIANEHFQDSRPNRLILANSEVRGISDNDGELLSIKNIVL